MKVTYIHHSSFLVEEPRYTLLFDYFEGELPDIAKDRPLYVFASHRHSDHFSPAIFDLAKDIPDVHYIISADIWKKQVPADMQERTVFLKPNTEVELGELIISTLKSTDEGVAFIITSPERTIYHAGDLNDWYWEEEGDTWNANMSKAYHTQIMKLKDRRIDVAFVPVDPRLEKAFSLGAEELLEVVTPSYLFPMHFWGDFSVCGKLKTNLREKGYATNVMEITHKGQSFELPV